MATSSVANAEEEWQHIDALLSKFDTPARKSGGRPKKTNKYQFVTENGSKVTWTEGPGRSVIEVVGEMDGQRAERLKAFITDLL